MTTLLNENEAVGLDDENRFRLNVPHAEYSYP